LDDDEFEKVVKQNQRKKMKVMAAYIGRAVILTCVFVYVYIVTTTFVS
jgi:hypothetical protein